MNTFSQRILLLTCSRNINNAHRLYSRWQTRSPAKILTVEEYEKRSNPKQVNWRQIPARINRDQGYEDSIINTDEVDMIDESKVKKRPKKQQNKPKAITTDMLQLVINESGEFIYTKMENTDPRVGSLLATVKSNKDKSSKDMVMFEGKRLIRDALESGCLLKYILFSRLSDLEFIREKLPKSGASLYKMPYKEMQLWSDLTTTPGIMGVFLTPDVENYRVTSPQLPLTIVLDNIREPGNLGAILRICAGVSCAKVILTKGCAGLWEPKVTRSAAGAHFRLKIHKKVDYRDIRELIDTTKKDKNKRVLIADNADSNRGLPTIPYYSQEFNSSDEIVLIIGGETEGVSDECYQYAMENNGVCVNIPLDNDTDSLNSGSALAVIAFEIKKQFVYLQNR